MFPATFTYRRPALQAGKTLAVSLCAASLVGAFLTRPARAQTIVIPAAPPAAPPPIAAQTPVQGFSPNAPAGLAGVTVPLFAVDGHGGPVVTVRLNNQSDALFLINTGPGSLITSKTATDLGLKRNKTPQGDTFVTLKSIRIGEIDLDGPVLVSELPNIKVGGKPVGGVLGSNIISQFAVLLDFDRKQAGFLLRGNINSDGLKFLGFNDLPTSVLTDSKGAPLSESSESEDFFTLARFKGGKGESEAYPLLVNSVSYHSVFPYLSHNALGDKKLGEKSLPTEAYGAQPFDVYPADSVQIGDMEAIRDLPVGVVSLSGQGITPTLGMDLLSRYRVLIDYPARKFYLAQPAGRTRFPTEASRQNAIKTLQAGTYALSMQPTPTGEWRVKSGSSPAALTSAGIAPGDTVFAVNNRRLLGLVSDQVTEAVSRKSPATLTLRRGNKTWDVVLTPKKIAKTAGN